MLLENEAVRAALQLEWCTLLSTSLRDEVPPLYCSWAEQPQFGAFCGHLRCRTAVGGEQPQSSTCHSEYMSQRLYCCTAVGAEQHSPSHLSQIIVCCTAVGRGRTAVAVHAVPLCHAYCSGKHAWSVYIGNMCLLGRVMCLQVCMRVHVRVCLHACMRLCACMCTWACMSVVSLERVMFVEAGCVCEL